MDVPIEYITRETLFHGNTRMVNFSKKVFRGDFSGMDFTGSKFIESRFELGSNLQDTRFWNADLSNATLSEVDLRGANLNFVTMVKTDLTYSNLKGAELQYSSCHDTNFSYSNLKETNFYKSKIHTSIFTGAIIKYVDFTFCTFTMCNMGTSISKSDLSEAEFSCYGKVRITDSILSKVRFTGHITDAVISYSDMSNTKFEGFEYTTILFCNIKDSTRSFLGVEGDYGSLCMLPEIQCQPNYFNEPLPDDISSRHGFRKCVDNLMTFRLWFDNDVLKVIFLSMLDVMDIPKITMPMLTETVFHKFLVNGLHEKFETSLNKLPPKKQLHVCRVLFNEFPGAQDTIQDAYLGTVKKHLGNNEVRSQVDKDIHKRPYYSMFYDNRSLAGQIMELVQSDSNLKI